MADKSPPVMRMDPPNWMGQILPYARAGLTWPPHCRLLPYDVGRKGIWYTYKHGRWFAMSYIYATDPRAADCEGAGAAPYLFDVRDMPKKYVGRQKIELWAELKPRETAAEIITRERAAHCKIIWRAIEDGFDFASIAADKPRPLSLEGRAP